VHRLPRKLSVDELAALFEGRTRFVERLAALDDPLEEAGRLLRALPVDEQREVLYAHPAIGAPALSATSAREQRGDADPAVLAELARLNRVYEEKFGFRFVIFVNRRSKQAVLAVLRARMLRTREEELATAFDELVAIAGDRYRQRTMREAPPEAGSSGTSADSR
jgi:2-oxo-4-hydroxy-4-carboxy--5-ureidoimidazoline (OHCU) decarboxylase